MRPGERVLNEVGVEYVVEDVLEDGSVVVKGRPYRKVNDDSWLGLGWLYRPTPSNLEAVAQRLRKTANHSAVYSAYCLAARLLKEGVSDEAGEAARRFIREARP